MNAAERKAALRASVREALGALTDEERRAKSDDICGRILGSALFERSRTLLLYLPTEEEVDVMPIARAGIERGVRVCFPRVEWESGEMRAHAVESVEGEAFEIRRHGVREPVGGSPVGPGEVSLVVVPGVVFSEAGVRIGRGGGFYDRFLHRTPATRLGVCFREQIRDSVQAQAHDVPMDAIVTDGRDMIVATDARRGIETDRPGGATPNPGTDTGL